MATRRWRGAGDEGAAGVAAPAIALGAWILLTPAMFSGTVLAAFAPARTAGRTQLEATVMRRAELRKVHALLERRGFLAMLAARLMPGVPATDLHYVAGVAPVGGTCVCRGDGARRPGADGPICRARPGDRLGPLATILIAGSSIAVGAVTAAVLVRRLRTPVAAT
jgi:hypothetical protein